MRIALVFALAAGLAASVSAQNPPPAPQEPAAPAQDAPAQPAAPQGQESPSPIRPYERVVTRDAKTDEGVFKVHRIRERVLYEIPRDMLGREFLLVTQIARTAQGAGYGGQPVSRNVMKWERVGDRVLLRSVNYGIVADQKLPIARAVQAANFDAIVMSFGIQALGKDEAPVIDVTRLFTTDVPETSARNLVRARGFDSGRSFVERVVAFPGNVEVEAIHTFNNPPDPAGAPATAPAPPRSGSASVLMHYSMVLLPATPMQPRLFDERVGYFGIEQLDYGKDEHRSPRRQYINRWRLEKKDPAADVSEPVTPIVYYIDPATPAKWVPYIKRGIEAWQPAFEAAGFRNAVVAKEAPSVDEDPDWSAEDARYSVVRWLPSTVENAQGPHVHDPRTGEILEADIQIHHNVLNLVRNWYFVQVGPLDARAKTLPLPDALEGDLLAMVVTHEVGHTLGLQHNMKASSLYPAAKLHDREWVKTMGYSPSVMDYARFHYVAQPEDGIDVADLMPRLGPYDRWAINWGYRPIPQAIGAEAERTTLDTWARTQDNSPWLRFNTSDARGSDPGELTEAIGDEDVVASTQFGLRNLERVGAMLLPATTRPGEPYDELDEVYARLLGQWSTELTHVAALVGGFNSQQKHSGQSGVRFEPVPRGKQAAAVAFLNANAFHVPAYLVNPEILRRVQASGALPRIRTAQTRVLDALLSGARLARLTEQEAIDGAKAYRPTDFLRDVRKGVWSEMYAQAPVRVDAYRRNLQRAYIDVLADRSNGRQTAPDDARAFFRGELRVLDADLRLARARAADSATRMHVDDVRTQIARALDPAVQAVPPAGARPAFSDGAADEGAEEQLRCWPDIAIR